jgi:hypothetical protein
MQRIQSTEVAERERGGASLETGSATGPERLPRPAWDDTGQNPDVVVTLSFAALR